MKAIGAWDLEGIIAKHIEKPYRSGRGEWWQKITCKRRDSFVIVGFEPSTVPGHLGRLLLAARKNDYLVYVGGCGTGWSHDLSRELRKLLEGMATKSPAVVLRRKGAVFTEPVLVADVEYRAWTDDGNCGMRRSRGYGSGRMMRGCLSSQAQLRVEIGREGSSLLPAAFVCLLSRRLWRSAQGIETHQATRVD